MADETLTITVTGDEALLLRTALALLRDTLGRDEADELREVKALIAKVDAAAGPPAGGR